MRPRNIELHIDELVLHGFALGDRYRIADAVERELARLLVKPGIPPSLSQGCEVAHVDGGMFEIALSSKLETIGVQVAQAVYRGLS
jgi:hypothetical protein